MKPKLVALALLAGSSLFAAPFYPALSAEVHRDYRRHEEYRAPRPHAVWIAPHYIGHRYYPGYWRR